MRAQAAAVVDRLIRHRAQVLICLAAVLVYLANFGSLGLLADDWCNLPRLRDLVLSGWPGIREIVTNDWMAGAPRVQFLSFLLQGLLAPVFGLHAAPYLVLILGAHLLASILVRRIVLKVVESEDTALAAAILFLVFPSSAPSLLFIKNWFLILPVHVFVLWTYLFLFPRKRPGSDIALLTGTALVGQFMGEGALPMFYAAFLWFGAAAMRSGPPEERRRGLLRAGIPLAACAVTLLVYVTLCVAGPEAGGLARTPGAVLRYAAGLFGVLFESTRFDSRFFGGLSVPVSWRTVAAGTIMAEGLLALFPRPGGPGREGRDASLRTLLFLALCFFASLLPYLYGAAIGYRDAAMPRYVSGAGLILAVALPIAVHAAARRLPERTPGARRWTFMLIAAYFICLSAYNVGDVWRAQRDVDERVWSAIESKYDDRVGHVITDGIAEVLLPMTRSNAVSFFYGGDYGIKCRLHALHGRQPRMARPGFTQEVEDSVLLTDYENREAWRAKKAEILAVTFRYAPSPAAGRSPLKVYRDFEKYKEFLHSQTCRPPP